MRMASSLRARAAGTCNHINSLLISVASIGILLFGPDAASGQSINVTSPASGAVWAGGQEIPAPVQWTASGMPNDATVRLWIENQDTHSGPLGLQSILPSDGQAVFTLPDWVEPGTNYRIKLEVTSSLFELIAEAYSDVFTITNSAPANVRTLTVTSPTSGATWDAPDASSPQTVTWQSTNLQSAEIVVELLDANALVISPMGGVLPTADQGQGELPVPSNISNGTAYGVQLQALLVSTAPGPDDFNLVAHSGPVTITNATARPTLSLTPFVGPQSLTAPIDFCWSDGGAGLFTFGTVFDPQSQTITNFQGGGGGGTCSSVPFCPWTPNGTGYSVGVVGFELVSGSVAMLADRDSMTFELTDSQPEPVLTLTSPTAGTQTVIGETLPITWTSQDADGETVLLNLYQDLGGGNLAPVTYIADIPVADGSFDWNTCDNVLEAGVDYIIHVSLVGAPVGCDTLLDSVNIEMLEPTLALTSPTAPVTWSAGSEQTLTWTSNVSVGNVGIDLYTSADQYYTGLGWSDVNDNQNTVGMPSNLPQGTYKIGLTLDPQCGPEPVRVFLDPVTINQATISGTVADPATLQGVPGLVVELLEMFDPWCDQRLTAYAITDANGQYSLAGLQPASTEYGYRLRVTNRMQDWIFNGPTSVYNASTGHWYKRFDYVSGFDNARRLCGLNGGDLAIFETLSENNWAFNNVGQDGTVFGATDRDVQGIWKWVDGTVIPPEVQNWANVSLPDNIGGIEHYAQWWPNGKWNDVAWVGSCICEYAAEPTLPEGYRFVYYPDLPGLAGATTITVTPGQDQTFDLEWDPTKGLPTISVAAPTAGESIPAGTDYEVQWTATNASDLEVIITLQREIQPGEWDWFQSFDGISADSGSYTIPICAYLQPANYQILVSLTAPGVGCSMNYPYEVIPINITGGVAEPTIAITEPTSATVWTVGASQDVSITWDPGALTGDADLTLMRAGTPDPIAVRHIAGVEVSDGAFTWDEILPLDMEEGSSYYVRLSYRGGEDCSFLDQEALSESFTIEQTSIEGTVRDTTLAPLSHVYVRLQGLAPESENRETFTDSYGEYKFTGVRPGDYNLVAAADPFDYHETPVGTEPIDGHDYQVHHRGNMGFDPAQRCCEFLDGYLARVTTNDENGWLSGFLGDVHAAIGAEDKDGDGQWQWTNGDPVGIGFWGEGQPSESLLDMYGILEGSSNAWYANPDVYSFVCEYDVGPDPIHNYARTYSPDTPYQAEATVFEIAAGMQVSGIDFGLSDGATITGRVTDAVTGNGIDDAYVWIDSRDRYHANCDSDGYYTIRNVPIGTYRLTAGAEYYDTTEGRMLDYITQYTNGSLCCDDAVEITIDTPTQYSGPAFDFALEKGGIIRGTVTQGGLPVEGVQVTTSSSECGWHTDNDYTNSNGDYLLSGLPVGHYAVFTHPEDGDAYAWEAYHVDPGNQPCLDRASRLNITGPSNVYTGIDIELNDFGHISGVVVDDGTGLPISGVRVFYEWWDGQGICFTDLVTHTDHNGQYQANLLPGNYRVYTGTHNYATAWYDGTADGSFDENDAQQVPVSVGGNTTANFRLHRTYQLTGTVVDCFDVGQLLSGVNLFAFPDPPQAGKGRGDDTNSTGGFSIALTSGTYDLQLHGLAGYYETTIQDITINDADINLGTLCLEAAPSMDRDMDRDVDMADFNAFKLCASGPEIPFASECNWANLDADGDVDQSDFAVFQRCFSGEGNPADPDCAD